MQAAEKALRQTAANNVESLVARLDLSSSQRAKVNVLLSLPPWHAAVEVFETTHENEIHNALPD